MSKSKKEIFKEVRSVIGYRCSTVDIEIKHNLKIDYGFDSMDRVEIFTELELEFDIEIEYGSLETVKDVVDYIYNTLNKIYFKDMSKDEKIKYLRNTIEGLYLAKEDKFSISSLYAVYKEDMKKG